MSGVHTLAEVLAEREAVGRDPLHRACARSREVRTLHALTARMERLARDIGAFLEEHQNECGCPVCAYMDTHHRGWWDDVATPVHILTMCASSLDCCLPVGRARHRARSRSRLNNVGPPTVVVTRRGADRC